MGTTVGVNDFLIHSVDELKVYPNPNNGYFIVEVEKETQIVIINILGEVILSKELNSGKNEIDLMGRSKGIYLANFKTASFKIVVE